MLSSNLGARPAPAIDTTDHASTGYWAYRLNVSPDDLAAAIDEVGPSVAAIRRHLGK
ncbi:hypothetical protein CSIRO_0416 [Bradyrhizobiaceae bacterium SG-6C]|nr:hypothetical protein CSIRO_0416 [Bradyrhizobiaceae bacterium SG-6C]